MHVCRWVGVGVGVGVGAGVGVGVGSLVATYVCRSVCINRTLSYTGLIDFQEGLSSSVSQNPLQLTRRSRRRP